MLKLFNKIEKIKFKNLHSLPLFIRYNLLIQKRQNLFNKIFKSLDWAVHLSCLESKSSDARFQDMTTQIIMIIKLSKVIHLWKLFKIKKP